MIIVKIELWPFGIEKRAREIGRISITNNLTGDRVNGNYDVKLAHAGEYANKPGVWKAGKVFNHLRALSPYHLVLKALQAALGK